MTDSMEFYASTIEEAVEKAALELGLSSEEVSYRVLDEGNSGFLGIGARDARIIVQASAPHASGEDEHPESTPAENVVVDEPEPEPSENAGSSTLSEVYGEGGFIAADVAPDNTALFIGQKGETIDALQYLVNVSAFRDRPFFKRIVLDAEGYRQRRVEAIQGMAHRTARRAVRERRTVEMPPMNSSERRVVHLFLSENPGVTTESEGTGDNRRVKVSPITQA